MAHSSILLNIIDIIGFLVGIASVVISCISLHKIDTIDNKIREVKLQGFEKSKFPQWKTAINIYINRPNTESTIALKKILYSIKEVNFFKDLDIVKFASEIIEELKKETQDTQSLTSNLLELYAKLEKEEHLM